MPARALASGRSFLIVTFQNAEKANIKPRKSIYAGRKLTLNKQNERLLFQAMLTGQYGILLVVKTDLVENEVRIAKEGLFIWKGAARLSSGLSPKMKVNTQMER